LLRTDALGQERDGDVWLIIADHNVIAKPRQHGIHHATGPRNWPRENTGVLRLNDSRENRCGRTTENGAAEIL
jgi:hypothetical protein